jgi:dienelactone hydrolase
MPDIEIHTTDGPARGYVAASLDDAAGAVIVIPEAFGLNDHIEDVTRRYPDADHGFHCDARPMFHQAASEDAFARTVKWIGEHLR